MDLAAKLKRLRQENDVSLQTLATICNCSKTTMSDLERGVETNPTIGTLKPLAVFYGVSLDYLAGLSNEL